MEKKIGIITMDSEAGQKYAEQIREVFDNAVEILLYNVQDGIKESIRRANIYLVSTSAIESCTDISLNIPIGVRVLDIGVEFPLSALEKLKQLPKGTKALFVNNSEFLVAEAVTRVQQLGIHHIDFYPYYPHCPEATIFSDISIAVTPGEQELVPAGITNIIDLGHRKLSPQMMVEIALELKLKMALEGSSYKNYFSQFHSGSYESLHKKLAQSFHLEDCFEVFLESLDDGVVGADENGEIFCFNKKASDILASDISLQIGKRIDTQLPFLPFDKCKSTHLSFDNAVKSIESGFVSFSLKPILNSGKFRGVFAVFQKFSETERKQREARMQIVNKGHRAKYTFDHIVGKSMALEKTKELALQMSATDFTILIYGESGTGKELFSSSIHNASSRSKCPYVAINCAAMPESLLESELFGYEDGAFTGAKKGGRLGLFELAHEGTIFLDEIENMSPSLQVKLLRVLQEREIMRVGGHQTISVNVRIIAATNEDLEVAVKDGRFRKDLYYRISTLPIKLPLLKQRKEDIFLLLDHFKLKYGKEFDITDEVRNILIEHSWEGNVRELQNCIEYFVCLNKNLISKKDLPHQFNTESVFNCKNSAENLPSTFTENKAIISGINKNKQESALLVLKILYGAYLKRVHLGRSSISLEAETMGAFISEQEVRTILKNLELLGFVSILKGRGGSKLTAQGIELASQIHCNNYLY